MQNLPGQYIIHRCFRITITATDEIFEKKFQSPLSLFFGLFVSKTIVPEFRLSTDNISWKQNGFMHD